MQFVETPVFTRQIAARLSDDEYAALQGALRMRPDAGRLLRGGAGLRKMRWAPRYRGTRGGLRVIYYWDRRRDVVYLLLAYAKSDQDDLTPAQMRALARLVREELK
jgi:mRNA-degrading endonuclease RelE of RelBE toxin-antitoxin system